VKDTFLQKGLIFFAATPALRIPKLSLSQTAIKLACDISRQSKVPEADDTPHGIIFARRTPLQYM
jgi:hypothetical protein